MLILYVKNDETVLRNGEGDFTDYFKLPIQNDMHACKNGFPI